MRVQVGISPIGNKIVSKLLHSCFSSFNVDEDLAAAMSKAHNKGKAGTGREQQDKGQEEGRTRYTGKVE
jgi:hypothetical protein